MKFWQRVTGARLQAEFQDETSFERSEAEKAVAFVVLETDVPPGAVSAGEINGGAGICVTLEGSKEWFVHRTYRDAASRAVEWIKTQGSEPSYVGGHPGMNRSQRRGFDKERKKKRTKRHTRARRRKVR